MEESTVKTTQRMVFCFSKGVKSNLFSTDYLRTSFFLKGKIENTIPKTMPLKIALLRLDTD